MSEFLRDIIEFDIDNKYKIFFNKIVDDESKEGFVNLVKFIESNFQVWVFELLWKWQNDEMSSIMFLNTYKDKIDWLEEFIDEFNDNDELSIWNNLDQIIESTKSDLSWAFVIDSYVNANNFWDNE